MKYLLILIFGFLLFSNSVKSQTDTIPWIHSYIKLKTHWKASDVKFEFRTCVKNQLFHGVLNGDTTVVPLDSVKTILIVNGTPRTYIKNTDIIIPVNSSWTSDTINGVDTIDIYFKAYIVGYPGMFADYEYSAKIANKMVNPTIDYLTQPTNTIFNLPLSLLETRKSSTSSTPPCNGNLNLNLSGGYPFSTSGDPYRIRYDFTTNIEAFQDSLCPMLIKYTYRDNWFGCGVSSDICPPNVYCESNCIYEPYFCEQATIEMVSCSLSSIYEINYCSFLDVSFITSTSDGAINLNTTSTNFSSSTTPLLPQVLNETDFLLIDIPGSHQITSEVIFADWSTATCMTTLFFYPPSLELVQPPTGGQVVANCNEDSVIISWNEPIIIDMSTGIPSTDNSCNYVTSDQINGGLYPVGVPITVTYTIHRQNGYSEEFSYSIYAAPDTNCCITGQVVCEDSGIPLNNVAVDINGLPCHVTVFTDANGNYTYCNDTVDYSALTTSINTFWLSNSGNTLSSQSGHDFFLSCLQDPCIDLSAQLSPWDGYFQGNTSTIILNLAGNNAPSAIGNYEVKLYFPNGLNFASSTLPGAVVSGNSLTWILSESSTSFNNSVFVDFFLPWGIAQDGDVHTFMLSINSLDHEECYMPDNKSNITFVVGNSYDPNDKVVDLPTYIDEDVVDQLTYTINFQNLGTAPAQHVYIIDTLSNLLDWSTFEVIGSSHNMVVSKFSNGVVRFDFPQIWLPTATDNEMLSNGYVTFKIKEKADNALRSEILNTGYIYFDANEAIVTSTTLNINNKKMILGLSDLSNESISIYPNPTFDIVTVKTEDSIKEIRILDTRGRLVETIECNSSLVKIDMGHYSNGVYTLSIVKENSVLNQKVIKK